MHLVNQLVELLYQLIICVCLHPYLIGATFLAVGLEWPQAVRLYRFACLVWLATARFLALQGHLND